MDQVLARSSAAVTVTATAVTLLDWLYVADYSGLTLIVDNVGGGGAAAISTLLVDNSDDGGATISTHGSNLLASGSIASGKAQAFSLVPTGSWIKVTAAVANLTTTAKLTLLASTSACRICTLADLKDRLGISVTIHDILLARIIKGMEAIFNKETKRTLILNAADVTEYYTGLSTLLQLKRYPVVSITTIRESEIYDFTNATVLTANDGYRIINGGKNGIIKRLYQNWLDTEDAIEIVYKGGYCAAGVTAETSETELPDDLREAAIMQASFIFKRKDDIGLTANSFQGGSISSFSAMDFLPLVKDILQNYRRPII